MATTKDDQLDRIEQKLDILLQRTDNQVGGEPDTSPLVVTRDGDHKYMPTDDELRKRTPVRGQN